MTAAPSSKRLRALFPAARPSKSRSRSPLAPLIGRDDTLERVALALSTSRLVTLTGPPGIGKTRLALAALERLTREYAHEGGAGFCDLSHVKTEDELRFAILTQLRDRFEGEHVTGGDLVEARIASALAEGGRTLLVLDNFEQIVFAAKVVERICEAAPELAVLVTSRERLAIDGEVVIELSPLSCPPGDADAVAIAESDAVRLFVKRARDAGGTIADAPAALATIVRHLEGIPLAIELAAARTRLLSVTELADRLEAGQAVLAGATRRAESRHATLANAIAWSWGLLAESEQIALARCAIFTGGFTLRAAESVIGEGAMDALSALRDKSLVHATDDGRLALYVSIRDYALAKLRTLEGDACVDTRTRHAQTYGAMARRFNDWRNLQDRAPDFSDAIVRRDKENLCAALAFIRTQPESDERIILATDLAIAVSALHALPGEACIEELSRSLTSLGSSHSDRRGLLLITRQSVYGSLGHYEASLADLANLRASSDAPRSLTLLALVYEGIQLRYQGYPREAWSRHATAAEELEHAGLVRLRAMNAACMGRLQFDLGDFAKSRFYNERALSLSDGMGDAWLGALALANLAQLEQEEQSFEKAHELFHAAMTRLRDEGEIYEAIYSGACGDLFFEWGKPDVARRWYEQSVRFFRGIMAHRHAALAHASAAAMEAQDGDLVRARALFAVAKRAASRTTNRVVDVGVALHGASIEIAESTDATRASVVAAWKKTIEELTTAGSEHADIVATSFDARFALRMARRAIDRFAPPPSEAAPRTLRVARDGRWFEVGGSERVELGRRGALRRILVALAEHHGVHRDQGIKQGDLVSAGWPGERVLVDAAATRVRVAIATLRRLGLRATLLTRDDGYVLDTNTRVELV